MTQAPTVEGLRVEAYRWEVSIKGELAGSIDLDIGTRKYWAWNGKRERKFCSYSGALGWIIKQHEGAEK